MAIPRRGSRTIEFQGERYRWYVRRKPTYGQGAFKTPMLVAIESMQPGAQRILLVDLGVSRPDNWIDSHQTALKPVAVREIISSAFRQGWDPHRSGTPFTMRYPLIRDLC